MSLLDNDILIPTIDPKRSQFRPDEELEEDEFDKIFRWVKSTTYLLIAISCAAGSFVAGLLCIIGKLGPDGLNVLVGLIYMLGSVFGITICLVVTYDIQRKRIKR